MVLRVTGYEFAAGARFQPGANANPAEVGEYMRLLHKEAGDQLTAQAVLNDARNNNSPLHTFFEWSDTKAAEQYRLSQARGLVRSVIAHIVDDGKGEERRKVRAYVHVPTEPGGGGHYREVVPAMSEAGTREIILRRAYADLNGWRRRYAGLNELAAICIEIERLLPAPKSPPGAPPEAKAA